MKRILILGQGDARSYFNVNGKSVFEGVPADIVLYADNKHREALVDLPSHVAVEFVRWSDPDAVFERAASDHAREPFSGVVHWDERTVELAERIRRAWNLQSHSSEQAAVFRDKIMMKDALQGIEDLRLPHYSGHVDRETLENLLAKHGRVVCKPRRGFGAKGVAILSTKEQINTWLAQETDLPEYECEQFIDGTLYHVNALVVEGRSLFTLAAPYLPGFANIDFHSGSPFVTQLETDVALRDTLERISARIISRLGLHQGVTHLECFVTPSGEIYFCEIAARPGGGGIVWMMEMATGINVVHALCRLEAGASSNDFSVATLESHESVCLIGMRSSQMGEVRSAPTSDQFAHIGAKVASLDLCVGDFVIPSGHCTDFNALFIFHASDSAEGLRAIKSIHQIYEKNLVIA